MGESATPAATISPSSQLTEPKKSATSALIGLVINLRWRAHLQELAGLHDGDLVGDGHGFDLIVGNIKNRGAQLFGEIADFAAHVFAQAGVEIAQRLVHEQQARVDGDGARQGDALLLPAAQQSRRAVGLFFQLDQTQRFFDPLGDFALGDALGALGQR